MNEVRTLPTPGPWEVSGETRTLIVGYDPRLYPEDERVVVARADPGGDRLDVKIGDANARLIAAAPELLDCLQRLTGDSYDHERNKHAMPCACAAWRMKARELIERIKGK